MQPIQQIDRLDPMCASHEKAIRLFSVERKITSISNNIATEEAIKRRNEREKTHDRTGKAQN